MKRAAWSLLLVIAFAALAAPWLAPNPPNRRFDDLLYAPPTRVHVLQDGVNAPFIYPLRLVSRLERRFEVESSRRVTLRWFTDGTLVTDADAGAPLLLLGADGYGRDVFSRLLHGRAGDAGCLARIGAARNDGRRRGGRSRRLRRRTVRRRSVARFGVRPRSAGDLRGPRPSRGVAACAATVHRVHAPHRDLHPARLADCCSRRARDRTGRARARARWPPVPLAPAIAVSCYGICCRHRLAS